MVKIQRALVSVFNKDGLGDLLKELVRFRATIISTGGTANFIKKAGLAVTDVSQVTGYPEMMDGRVKTLHPVIHGGLLAIRGKPDHEKAMKDNNILPIDMVVVNLYPFQETVKKPGVTLEEAIENIDIGGPAMLRSASKNFQSVVVVPHPKFYQEVIKELQENHGSIGEGLRKRLAVETFKLTSEYDTAVHNYLASQLTGKADPLPQVLHLTFQKKQDLRYGENPHQKAAFYSEFGVKGPSLTNAVQLHGKELSYNNIVDLESALDIIKEFEEPAVVIIKHNNPCGVASSDDLVDAFQKAYVCDPTSAFGGILSVNRNVDGRLADNMVKTIGFFEAIIAPSFDPAALDIFRAKKDLRVLSIGDLHRPVDPASLAFKKISGGLLLQDNDSLTLDKTSLKVVTKVAPTDEQMKDLIFAWKVAKYVKSNAIVFAKGRATVGVGAGQMNRVGSVEIASRQAGAKAQGAVLASDAFFPFRDNVDAAAKAGIKAIIQPGGSMRDAESIKAADEHGLAMVFTGIRHFRH